MSDKKNDGSFNPSAGPVRRLLPANKYLMEVAHAEKTLSSTGKARLTFKMKVAAGPEKGRQWTEDCYLTENAAWKLNALCGAVGITSGFNTDDPAELIETFVGKKLFVTIAPDEYDNDKGESVESRKSTAYDSTVPSKPEQKAEARQKTEGGEETPF